MIVMKFGGTSVQNASALRQVASIVADHARQHDGVVAVLSATAGTTSQLLDLARHAAGGCSIDHEFETLEQRHLEIARELGVSSATIEVFLTECREHLDAAAILGECTPQTYDAIAGYGELLSTTLFALYLTSMDVEASWVDARRLVITDDEFQSASVDIERTIAAANATIRPLAQHGSVIVTQGFVGATSHGIPTTLGRGGSDYSAAIIGRCLDATEIQIWTDVSGVYTCDPRIVPTATPLKSISFNDIRTLALYGAKVLHPETVEPAIAAGIPVRVLNTFEPEAPGTVIQAEEKLDRPITALSLIRPCRRIHTDDKGMVALTSIESINENIALLVRTLDGYTIVVHEADDSIRLAVDVAAVGQAFTQESTACIAVCGVHITEGAVVARVNASLDAFTSCTTTSLLHPRCMLVTTPLDQALDVCASIHALVASSSSSDS